MWFLACFSMFKHGLQFDEFELDWALGILIKYLFNSLNIEVIAKQCLFY